MSFTHGSIIKNLFPYDEDPYNPGPVPHYGQFVANYNDAYIVTYGSSVVSPTNYARYGSIANCILTVTDDTIVGDPLPGPIGYYIATRIAIVHKSWIDTSFNARLDYVPKTSVVTDEQKDLYLKWYDFMAVAVTAGKQALVEFKQTGKYGLYG